MSPRKLSKSLIFAALLVCVSFQAFQSWKEIVKPWLHDRLSFVLASAPHRGAIYYMGEDRARFMRFLDAYLPEDAEVVLPPRTIIFSNQNIMQNYLFPRAILSCFGDDLTLATKCLSDKQNYVLAVGDFPSAEQVPGRVLVPYPDGNKDLRGIYVPEGQVDGLRVPSKIEYGKTVPISIRALLTDILIMGLLFFLGALIVSIIVKNPRWVDLLELAIPLAMGFLSWLLFILSFGGARLGLSVVFVTYVFLVLAGLIAHYLLYKSLPVVPKTSVRELFSLSLADTNRIVPLLFGLTLGLVAIMTFLAVANGYSDFDSIANWSLKGYAIAGTGSIWAGAKWGGHVLSYPLNMALSIAIFKLADGDLIPGSKFLYAFLTISLLTGCYRLLVRHGASKAWAIAGVLALLTTPVFFRFSMSGEANLPFTAYLVLGTLHSLEGLNREYMGDIALGGLLLAFAAWTRPEGVMFGTAFLGLIYLLAFLVFKVRPKLKYWLASFLPMIVFPLSWMVLMGGKSMGGDQIGQTIRGFLGQATRGNLRLDAIPILLDYARKSFSSTELFGPIMGAALLLILLSAFFARWHRDPFRTALMILTVLAFLLPAALFFVAYFREPDYPKFLNESFNRAYLPALTMSILAAILALTHEGESPPSVPAEVVRGAQATE